MQDNFSIRSWKNEKVYKEEYDAAAAKVKEQDELEADDYERTGLEPRTFVDPKDLMPSAIANKMLNKEQDELEADDIELEIPGDESTATVDKTVQAKASKQDQIIKDFQRLQNQMKTHLELYKTSESPANKETAKNMLKKLTPEFQAAKKAYEKLKGVKI